MNTFSAYRSTNQNNIGGGNFQDTYKKPIPIDTINKFWGIDSKILIHDDTVQKQSFDQAYKNFWSFVDFNAAHFNSSEQEQRNESQITAGTGFSDTRSQGNFNKSRVEKQSNLSYQEARRRADEILRAQK